jgi:hypothetical protein
MMDCQNGIINGWAPLPTVEQERDEEARVNQRIAEIDKDLASRK